MLSLWTSSSVPVTFWGHRCQKLRIFSESSEVLDNRRHQASHYCHDLATLEPKAHASRVWRQINHMMHVPDKKKVEYSEAAAAIGRNIQVT